ncbi:MAG: hypothetical protein ACXWPS_16350 [Ktedonobacteraceae bacterium]
MLEFEIRAFPKVRRPVSGLVALHQKIPLLQKLALDSYPDSKTLEKWLKQLESAAVIALLASDFKQVCSFCRIHNCRWKPEVWCEVF